MEVRNLNTEKHKRRHRKKREELPSREPSHKRTLGRFCTPTLVLAQKDTHYVKNEEFSVFKSKLFNHTILFSADLVITEKDKRK